MKQVMKTRMKAILAWVLAFAMTFANVDYVSAAVVVESVEDAVVEDVSVNDVSAGSVSESDPSTGNVSEGNVAEEDVTTGDISGGDVTTGDISEGDVTTGDVSEGNVTEVEVSDGDVSDNAAAADGTEGASSILDSGEWHGITWQLTVDGVLTIGGEDTNTEAEEVYFKNIPWYKHRMSIVEVVITARNVKSTQSWFDSCENMTKVDLTGFDSSQVTDMRSMFSYCYKLTEVDVRKLDTSKVTDMRNMFFLCKSITQLDFSKCDMNNVTDISNMFADCHKLSSVKLGKANSGKLQKFDSVFASCYELKKLQLGKLNTENVTSLVDTFSYCKSLESLNLSSFDTGNVTSMRGMFTSCESLKKLNISGFDTSKVTDMADMFNGCKSLASLDVSGFDTGNVTNMQYMFTGCESLTKLDVSGFDTAKVTNMRFMFSDCLKVKELDVRGFNTSNVTQMDHMFFECDSLIELDLSGLDTAKAEKMAGMANGCDSLGRIKLYVNLQQQVSLPQAYGMYDLDGNRYEDYYPMGLTESFWLYFDPSGADGNMWVKEIAPQTYTGKAVKPEVLVYNGRILLTEKVDYTISYKNNTKANDASNAKTAPSIIVKGKGNYSKQDVVTFQILPRELTDEGVKTTIVAKMANGKVQKPVPVITYNGKKLVNKKDFTVSYPDLNEANPDAYKAPGTYRILVTGKGNFGGQREILFTITKGTLMSKVKIASIKSQEYTGSEIEPEVKVTHGKTVLVKGKDYTVSYENNVEVGKGTVIVTGMGNYAGSKTATFKITGKSIAKAKVTGVTDLTYSGSELEQEFTVAFDGQAPLVEGKDYTVKYTKNINPGKATMTITGMGRYTGTIKKTFKVKKLDLKDARGYGWQIMNGAPEPEGYGGQCVWYSKGGTTKLKFNYFEVDGIELVEGKDYTISYVNNIRKITAPNETKKPIARVKGKGKYTGVMEFEYSIVPSDFSSDRNKVTLTIPDVVYSAKPGKFMSKPVLTDYNGKKLKAGVDYDKNIEYYLEDGTKLTKDSVVEAGQTIKVVVTGKGNYTGVKEGTYRVTQASIKDAKFKITPQVYTGYHIWIYEWNFEVAQYGGEKLSYGDDYTVISTKNNLKKGTASVTIRGLGNYGGTKTVKFKIVSKEMIWFWKMFD